MDREKLEARLAELPLYTAVFFSPQELEFAHRVRHICQSECPMYNKSWACPPAVGDVADCKAKCMAYDTCLMIATVTEVSDITNIDETLATRPEHEAITNEVRDILVEMGAEPLVLSTEACALCPRCAWLDGKPCRFPERMHPCVESYGIVLIPTAEKYGIAFQYGENVVTWFSLLFFQKGA